MKISAISRIYTSSSLIKQQTISLRLEYLHYFKNVLRLQKGETIRIFNGLDGEFGARIKEFNKQGVFVDVGSQLRAASTLPHLSLGLCIIKQDRMLDALDMATQLGVTEIIPLISEYSQSIINIEKAERRLIQATEQSERFCPPVLAPPLALKDFSRQQELLVYANENESEEKTILRLGKVEGRVSLLIGPEGGFSEAEREMLASWPNAESISLGSLVLRTETAVAAALAQLRLVRHHVPYSRSC